MEGVHAALASAGTADALLTLLRGDAEMMSVMRKRTVLPLLAVASGTGDVLMARLRKGRANTARGARQLPP